MTYIIEITAKLGVSEGHANDADFRIVLMPKKAQ
jgi:hypothetical protein